MQRDSANVLGGTYSVLSVLGFKLKLEQNSYDYEDQYNYMLSINEDYLSGVETDEDMAEDISDIIVKVLRKNVSFEIAQEKADRLVIHSAKMDE